MSRLRLALLASIGLAIALPSTAQSFLERLKAVAAAAAASQAASQPGAQPGSSDPGNPALAANPLAGTELDKIFQKKPISNSNQPERWPRVAITVKSGSTGVFAIQGQRGLSNADCMVFDAKLWHSAKDSKNFENLRLCTPAVEALSKGVAYRTLELFPRFTVPRGENSTANQRTDGPTQPFYLFPQDIKSQQQWVMGPWNNKFFLGALLVALGYDWDNDFDRRLWVVSVPHAAG